MLWADIRSNISEERNAFLVLFSYLSSNPVKNGPKDTAGLQVLLLSDLLDNEKQGNIFAASRLYTTYQPKVR